MNYIIEMEDNPKMAITPKGLKFSSSVGGVMIAGYILLMGGGVKDPQVFNYAMFDFRRLAAAPLVIIAGIVIVIVAIMGVIKEKKKKE